MKSQPFKSNIFYLKVIFLTINRSNKFIASDNIHYVNFWEWLGMWLKLKELGRVWGLGWGVWTSHFKPKKRDDFPFCYNWDTDWNRNSTTLPRKESGGV